jgi:3',5'-cyclic AMP phosphodiesterase CpdA
MKRFISAGAYLGTLLAALLLMSCSGGGLELGDLTTTGSSDVKGRFENSTKGQTKGITLPPVNDPNKFSFVWMTDTHYRPDRQDYLDRVANFVDNSGARFVLNSGDLTDRGDNANFDYFINHSQETLSVPFYSAIGNHDLYGDGWDAFRWKIGPSVTSFTYGNSFFMFIDSASCEVGRDQMDWIEDQLQKSYTSTNRFVLSHLCLYDSDLETPAILCDPDERLHLASMMKKYHVDYFLCGHKHWVEEDNLDGFNQIMGGTPSPYKKPYNSDPVFWNFTVNGSDVEYERVEMND